MSAPPGPTVPTFTYSGTSKSFSVGSLLVTPTGTTVYSASGSNIYSATLGSAYDLSSFTTGSTFSYPFNLFINHTGTAAFNADGTALITVVSDGGYFVSSYPLATPYDVSTMVNTITKSTSSLTLSGVPTDLKFANGGTVGYITVAGVISQYNLTSAYDLNSFSGSPDNTLDTTTTFSLNSFGPAAAFALSTDGSVGYIASLGNSYDGTVTQFVLATPYDISTATTPAAANITGFSQNGSYGGIVINSSNTKLLVAAPSGSIYQFNGS